MKEPEKDPSMSDAKAKLLTYYAVMTPAICFRATGQTQQPLSETHVESLGDVPLTTF